MLTSARRTACLLGAAASVAISCTSFAAPATQPSAAPGPFLKQVESHFSQWDANHDGTLAFNEIETICNDPSVRGPVAAAAAVMRNRAALRGQTLAQYRELLTSIAQGQTVNTHEQGYQDALRKLADINRELFPNGLPGTKAAQGKLGDCFLLASVGTLAQTDPQRLRSLVESAADGQVAVNFADGHRVVLPAPTDAEVIIGATTRGDGVWVNVFEKAIGSRLLERQTGPRAQWRHLTPYSIIGVGGTPNVPAAMLTGHRFVRVGCEMFQKPGLDDAGKKARLDEIRNILQSALSEHRLVVGGTGPLSGTGVKVKGLYYNHSYGILGYDRATDLVHFWNPMSNGFTPKGPAGLENGYPTSYGRFDCPLTEAVMWFGSLSVEQNEPLAPTTQAAQ